MTPARTGRPRPANGRASPRRVLLALAALTALHAGSFGCLRVEHGIVVELALSALPSGGADRVWLGDETELVVEDGSVGITEASLLPCRDVAPRLEEAARALLGPARAVAQHDHEASPLTIAGPVRVSLVDAVTILGSFTPPPGRYCGVHLEVAPGRPELDEPTLAVRAHTLPGEPIVAASHDSGALHLELAEPLELAERGTTVLRASLFLDRPFAGLTGVADLGASPEARGTALLRGAARQSAIWVEPTP